MPDSTWDKLRAYNYLFAEIQGVYHEYACKQGISDSTCAILYAICNKGDCCPLGEICRLSGMSRQTIHSAVRKLEQEGLVYLQAMDGKAKRVCLSEAGKKLAEEVIAPLFRMENSIYCSWPEEDLQQYLTLTQRFLDGLRENVKEIDP